MFFKRDHTFISIYHLFQVDRSVRHMRESRIGIEILVEFHCFLDAHIGGDVGHDKYATGKVATHRYETDLRLLAPLQGRQRLLDLLQILLYALILVWQVDVSLRELTRVFRFNSG